MQSATLSSVAALVFMLAACTRRPPPGLDEAAFQSAAMEPDGPPVTGAHFGEEQRLCNQGDAHGCFAIGSAFLVGSAETTKDEARAARLFWKGCVANDAMSFALVGHAFRDGTGGLRPDLAVAKKHYAKACSLGHEASCPRATSKNGY